MTKTTIGTLTNRQITKLRDEAATAGDTAQVEVCERALRGDRSARVECARVIADAEAQAD